MDDRPTANQLAVHRPLWATLLAAFCATTAVFLVVRDVFVPEVRDVEVWFGFEVHGWLAWASAPVHWLLFVVGARGYWKLRSWVWPWASVYGFYIAVSHLVWNLTSVSGGGLIDGTAQMMLFSVPAVALLLARPTREENGSSRYVG